jgi:hypothetical protein
MRRYPVTLAELEAAMGESWLRRARSRTERFRQAGRYDEPSGIWSEIKGVYVALQDGKCAYCERKIGTDPAYAAESDLEHFRPKARVQEWDGAPGGAEAKGYYLLAYHPFNYAMACIRCNRGLKLDRFPVAGVRILDGEDPVALRSEAPLLLYPIGDVDDDPAELISFVGYAAVPAGDDVRARVTIAFFRLGAEAERDDDLVMERARVVRVLYMANLLLRAGTMVREFRDEIAFAQSPAAPHSRCAACYQQVCERDWVQAELLFGAAGDFLRSKGLL